MGILHAFLKSQKSKLGKGSTINDQTCYYLDCFFLRRHGGWEMKLSVALSKSWHRLWSWKCGLADLYAGAPPSVVHSYLHQ